jgi:thiol-disulfide isomerase/thioredoxin
MIDFWASWCGPCRQENPNVVKLYQQYHAKGFEIIGVSLDKAKEDWVKAIQDDQLSWIHVSDLQYWQNSAARLYGVNAIPQTYLLDKDGKIIAKGLRSEQLAAKLNELFLQ